MLSSLATPEYDDELWIAAMEREIDGKISSSSELLLVSDNGS